MRLLVSGALLMSLTIGIGAQDRADDLMARGAQLIQTKPAEAVRVLQQALRLNPDLPGLHYQLGLALHAIGDEADSAIELREAVDQMPDSAAAHDFLGIALFQTGNAKAALEEFRSAVKLAPRDANAHFNLAEALARTGQSSAGIEDLRVASGLAAAAAGLSRLVKAAENAVTLPETTIRVDVRQVLVPVVVTDPEGHHVTGLTQGDFKVFEDGVEQKITAFSVEHSGAPATATAATSTTGSAVVPASPPTGVKASPRRTYLILIDTLHASFNNFVSAREALLKLFRQEHSEDSQYVAIALGTSPEMIVNVTRDPNAVLAALQSPKFQKIFLDGQQGGLRPELERYRRDLNETRVACDTYAKTGEVLFKLKCETGKDRVPRRAQEIAELDRALTVGFLRQFRFLIGQLSNALDRRTVVFLSDGFEIAPGREAYDLLTAYFPDLQRYALRTVERLQDEFEPILRIAAKSNITIDTIDSRGLFGQKTFDASGEASTCLLYTSPSP